MNYLSNKKIKNKRIILRCDFNVPVNDGNISDDSKITKSFKTINYLLENNNTIILMSHFGRIKKEEDKKSNSLKIVYEYLKKYYDLEFINNPLELEIINNSTKKIFLVENTRYTDIPLKRESANDLELAYYWSKFADIFVIDAFASLHRAHASTAGLSKYLPTYLGFLVEEEIKNLQPLITIENRPFLVIMGGAKVDDKIKIIESIINRCDKLIITGGILNTFLKVKGYNIGGSLVSSDEEVLTCIKNLLINEDDKIFFSNNFIVRRNEKNLNIKIEEMEDNDIILDNIVESSLLDNLNMVFLNGTCGKYEEEPFGEGTKKLLKDLSNKDASIYVGGGDTVSAVKKFHYQDKFTYISSGGGATLEYVAYNKLKALEYIKDNDASK